MYNTLYRLYNEQWHGAQVDLAALLDIERPVVPEKPQKVSKPDAVGYDL
jgi:hypothetical protein